MEPWEKLGIPMEQYGDMAERGILPAYRRKIESEQAMQAELDTTAHNQEMNTLRDAQGDYDLQQQRKLDAGLTDENLQQNYAEPGFNEVDNRPLADTDTLNNPFAAGAGEAAMPQSNEDIARDYYQKMLGYDPLGAEFGQLEDAERQAMGVEQIRAKGRAEALAIRNDTLVDLDADRQELNDTKSADMDQRIVEMETLSDEIGNTKIESGRYWANKSTGDKILAGIALAIGGYAEGAYGIKNAPMAMLQKAIDNDIAEQKSNYGIKKGELADKKSAYAMAMDKFKNENMALASAELSAVTQTERQIEQQVANTEDPMVKAKGQAAIAKLRIQGKKSKLAFQEAAAKKIQANTPENDPDYIEGYGVTRNPKYTKDFADKAIAFDTTDQSINEITGMMEGYGFTNTMTPGDETYSKINSLTSMLQGNMRVLILGPGTVNKDEYDRLVAIVPMGASSNPVERKKARVALKTLQGFARRAMESEAKIKIKNYVPKAKQNSQMGMTKEVR